jgi:hypothetical protein
VAYIPNFTWTVKDGDQVQSMARAGYTVDQIATIMHRKPADVDRFCTENHVFVRTKPRVRA